MQAKGWSFLLLLLNADLRQQRFTGLLFFMAYKPAITVRELIVLLQAEDPDLPVHTQGCDCSGDAGGVKVEEFDDKLDGDKYLLITRQD